MAFQDGHFSSLVLAKKNFFTFRTLAFLKAAFVFWFWRTIVGGQWNYPQRNFTLKAMLYLLPFSDKMDGKDRQVTFPMYLPDVCFLKRLMSWLIKNMMKNSRSEIALFNNLKFVTISYSLITDVNFKFKCENVLFGWPSLDYKQIDK